MDYCDDLYHGNNTSYTSDIKVDNLLVKLFF